MMDKKNIPKEGGSLLDVFSALVRQTLKGEEYYARMGRVKSVDVDNSLASIELIGGATLDNVMLQKVKDSSGFVVIPTIDSVVLVEWMDPATAYIAMYSGVDTIALRGGSFGGLIKVEELISKLNALESDINDLKSLLGAVVPVAYDGGAAILAAVTSWTGSNLQLSKREDLENNTITHGDGD